MPVKIIIRVPKGKKVDKSKLKVSGSLVVGDTVIPVTEKDVEVVEAG